MSELMTDLVELLQDKKIQSLELCKMRGQWRLVYINKNYHDSYLYDTDTGYLILEDKK